MSGNSFGTLYKITTFGESHGSVLGVVIDGIEPGFTLDVPALQEEMDRRRPGSSHLVTQRNEADKVKIVSGLFEGKTTGAPLTILIENTNTKSSDYEALQSVFRPGHADWTWQQKYQARDYRGGGRTSGRETVARVAAGAVAKQILAHKGIHIEASLSRLGGIAVTGTHDERVAEIITSAKESQDSIGGIVHCRIIGCPAGLGEPVFEKLDALLAQAIISIGAVKGIEFGSGFACADMKGSEHNDGLNADEDGVSFSSNHAGGMLGGISNGMPIIFNVAVKPTPSIALTQRTVTTSGEETDITIAGRHDPTICLRIIPVIESMAALVVLDLWYRQFGVFHA